MFGWGVAVFAALALVSGPVWAEESLNKEGFPAEWTPKDFLPGAGVPAGTTKPMKTNEFFVVPPYKPLAASSGEGMDGGNTVLRVENEAGGGLAGFGVLTPATGGQPASVWQSAAAGRQEAAITGSLARGVASPALREAWRRLLLSEAVPPKPETGPSATVPTNWLAVRAGALERLGLYEAAWSLWRQVPVEAVRGGAMAEDEDTVYGWVGAKLLAGQGVEACEVARTRVQARVNQVGGADVPTVDARWPVVVAVCQLLAPQQQVVGLPGGAAASLSLQVVEPMLRGRDPALLKILTAVQDGKPVHGAAMGRGGAGTLGGAVLAVYPALVGEGMMLRLPDVALRRIVKSPLPDALRAPAAVALAGATGWPEDGQVAWRLVSDTAVSAMLPDAVMLARGVSGSEVGPAAAYVTAALRLGSVAAARAGMGVWDGVDGLKANEVRERLQGQMALGFAENKVDDTLWDTWRVAQTLENAGGVRQALRTLLAGEAMGVAVPERVWRDIRDRSVPVSDVMDVAWKRLLDGAVAGRDVPRVLGLMSDAWAGEPANRVMPDVLGASVAALRAVGQEDIALRVMAEGLTGLPVAVLPTPARPVAVSATVPVRAVDEGVPVLPPPRVKSPSIKAPVKPAVPAVTKPHA